MEKIKVNDKVKIIDSDQLYTTYSLMFNKLGFINKEVNRKPDNYKDLIFNVEKKSRHKTEQVMLYFIKCGNVELLISKKGIEKAEKTYTLTETFVKELCKEPNIKEAFVREGIVEEEKLEVGKWYKDTRSGSDGLFFLEEIKDHKTNGMKSYGFTMTNKWDYSAYRSNEVFNKHMRLATPQEVENALISEAKKRGFVDGIKYRSPEIKIINTCNNNFSFDFSINTLYNNGIAIFRKGTWAEIIEENRTIEIPLKDILATPNSYELGEMVRKLANDKL